MSLASPTTSTLACRFVTISLCVPDLYNCHNSYKEQLFRLSHHVIRSVLQTSVQHPLLQQKLASFWSSPLHAPHAAMIAVSCASNSCCHDCHKYCQGQCFQESKLYTVKSLGNGCFDSQENCPYAERSLLRGTTAVRMQWLVTNGVTLTSRLSLHQVSLQREFTVI